jgi:phosphoserine phosphatase
VFLDLLDELGHRRQHDRHVLDRQRRAHEHVARRRHDALPRREEHQLGGGWRVPAFVRWPGKIPAGRVTNEIVHHMDWLPTFLAAAGDDNVKEDLLDGYRSSAMDRNYRVHLDGYNILPLLTGETDESPHFVPPPSASPPSTTTAPCGVNSRCIFSLFFALDRVKEMAPQHPEWKNKEPFASLLKGDVKAALAGGEKAILEIVMATHAGMTTTEFEKIVKDWIATARHPKTGRYTEMVYQPMLELLAYLRANDFKTFIVSGGGIEFMRPWTEAVYGIPPEQVVGSSIKTQFEMRDGGPVLVRLPKINFIDDKEGKPVGINAHIGRRPVAAFGNSDGDLQMLQWTTAGDGRASRFWSTTPMPSVNGPTTENRTSASSIMASTKVRVTDGPSLA